MSVPAYKRKTSNLEYVENALQLVKLTIFRCSKLPKRWNMLITKPLSEATVSLYQKVLTIKETYYAKSDEEIYARSKNIGEALGLLDLISTFLDIIVELNPNLFSSNVLEQWIERVSKQRVLLAGVKTKQNKISHSNIKKYKNENKNDAVKTVVLMPTTPTTLFTSTTTATSTTTTPTTRTAFALDSNSNSEEVSNCLKPEMT